LILELAFQPQQVGLQVGREGRRAGLAPLAADGLAPGVIQHVEAGDAAEQIVMPGGHAAPPGSL
jgi:hypothetical protein